MRKIHLILLFILISGCAGCIPAIKPVNKCVCAEKDSSQDRLKRDSGKVVLVYTRDKDMNALTIGTGFVVDKNGIIMTAKHVVDDPEAKYIFVKIIENDKTIVKKVAEAYGSLLYDVVVLKINHTFKEAVKFRQGHLSSGESLYTIGYPLAGGKGLVYTDPSYSVGEFLKVIAYGSSDALMQLSTMHAAPGFSGAPIFDAEGRVIGLISLNGNFTSHGSTFVFSIPADVCDRILKAVQSGIKK